MRLGFRWCGIHFRWGENELKMWEHGKQVSREIFHACGAEYQGAASSRRFRDRVCMKRGRCGWETIRSIL